MSDELKGVLEWLKTCGNNDYIFETGNSKMLLDYITNLQETIDFQDKWLEYYKAFISENNIKEYKSRCEKAIEFVKKNCNGIGVLDIEKLLNILEGKEDE